jgi:hypothetical protein
MDWQPITTAPKNIFLEVCGPSGYITVPIRIHVAQFNTAYKSSTEEEGQWRTHSNNHFTDDGGEPTHWRHLSIPNGY